MSVNRKIKRKNEKIKKEANLETKRILEESIILTDEAVNSYTRLRELTVSLKEKGTDEKQIKIIESIADQLEKESNDIKTNRGIILDNLEDGDDELLTTAMIDILKASHNLGTIYGDINTIISKRMNSSTGDTDASCNEH